MRRSKAWYDEFITPDNLKKYYQDSYANRNIALYKLVEPMLPGQANVLDIASGCSFNAKQFLADERVKKYTMNDFADIVRDDACTRIKDERFSVCERDAEQLGFNFREHNVVICVSLEHIENDLQLVERCEPGTLMVLGSPNGDARAHVRFFLNISGFIRRYEDLVDIKGSTTSGSGRGREKYVICGYRR